MSLIIVTKAWDRETTPPRVKALLTTLNRTQQQLANVLGVSFVTVNRWMNKATIPDKRSRAMLEKLERTYLATDE
jgi:DNA-binding transcriptional regulator YiaG